MDRFVHPHLSRVSAKRQTYYYLGPKPNWHFLLPRLLQLQACARENLNSYKKLIPHTLSNHLAFL